MHNNVWLKTVCKYANDTAPSMDHIGGYKKDHNLLVLQPKIGGDWGKSLEIVGKLFQVLPSISAA